MHANLLTIFPAILLATLPGGLEPAPVKLDILGSYQGEVFDAGAMTPISTRFFLDAEGKLQGGYHYQGLGGLEKGTLKELTWETSRILVGIWSDVHGEGRLRLHFARDFRSFRGAWGIDDDDLTNLWTGRWNGKEPPLQP